MSCSVFRKEAGVNLQEMKQAWADAVLSGREFSSSHPLRFSHPIAEALSSPGKCSLKIEGLSISELCQLALLRSPFDRSALAKSLFPFHDFPTLWSKEATYNPHETKLSIDLLCYFLGKKEILPEGMPPYFQALAKVACVNDGSESDGTLGTRLDFGSLASIFVCQGKGVPLGAMKVGNIDVPAFGPQLHPLNDSKRFGVDLKQDASKWALVSAEKEIWFEHSAIYSGFETRFFGITLQKAISFVFHVKADSATISGQRFFPKTLNRFSNEADTVAFERKGTLFSIKATSRCKVELIPLAGGEDFWGSDFLLAFEVPRFDGRLGFQCS